MKMYYGNVPIKSMNIKHYEMDTNDCTAIPSDLQAGVTCVSKGQKITGTGKTFEFAQYGKFRTNLGIYVPSGINVIEVGSSDYPVKIAIPFSEVRSVDFSTEQTIAKINVGNSELEITARVENNILTLTSSETIYLEAFYAKDNY